MARDRERGCQRRPERVPAPQGTGSATNMPTGTWLRLAAGWASVAAFLTLGAGWLGGLADPLLAALLFAWLLAVIIWLAFGVVHEAEELAEMLGEPFGTLILTLAIVIIEVALIGAVMLGAKEAPTLGRDTMFAVLMIVLNGVVGLGLLV